MPAHCDRYQTCHFRRASQSPYSIVSSLPYCEPALKMSFHLMALYSLRIVLKAVPRNEGVGGIHPTDQGTVLQAQHCSAHLEL